LVFSHSHQKIFIWTTRVVTLPPKPNSKVPNFLKIEITRLFASFWCFD